jgi:hypothetical protein
MVTPTMAEHVVYEVGMMWNAVERLKSLRSEVNNREFHRSNPRWEVENNAYLESFLIHYRNVMDFLSPRGSVKPDDITAGPFINKGLAHRIPDTPIDHRTAIDKFLAHLSKTRGSYDMKWPVQEMLDGMVSALSRFLDQLDPDRRAWFVEPNGQAETFDTLREDTYRAWSGLSGSTTSSVSVFLSGTFSAAEEE